MKTWICNLKMGYKIVLILFFSLSMVTPPTWIAVKSELTDYASAKKEASGLPAAGDLLSLIQSTQEHRVLSASFLSGNENIASERAAKQAEIEKTLGKLKTSILLLDDAELRAKLEPIEHTISLITAAVASKSMSATQSYTKHSSLVETEHELLDGIIDSSTMALDPTASSYYLINAVLMDTPDISKRFDQMRMVAAIDIATGSWTPEERVRVDNLIQTTRGHLEDARSSFAKSIKADPVIGEILNKPFADVLATTEEALTLTDENILQADKPSISEADYMTKTSKVLAGQFDMVKLSFKTLDSELTDRLNSARNHLLTMVGLVFFFGAISLWVISVVAITTTQAVHNALEIARTVASGDLTSRIKVTSKDETGQLMQALNDMNESLTKVVGQVRSSSDSIATGTAEIASGNADLSSRTEQQASSLEETASAMEELTSTVKQNAENARQANQLAAGASDIAIKGGSVIRQVVDTMDGISTSSKKIADIIGVIDGIAFQTNILALNAAVEAARAGEQGRGFAVVASEVRNLAQRSAAAAKEIKELISDSAAKVDAGTAQVDQAGKTMDEIVTSVKRVTDIMSEIAAASQEQSAGIAQVGNAITQMDEVTQQNAALVEQAAAAAESLEEQAQILAQAVALFVIDATGRHHAPASTAPVEVERRGPNRSKNIARLPARSEPTKTRAPTTEQHEEIGGDRVAKLVNSGDDWTEF